MIVKIVEDILRDKKMNNKLLEIKDMNEEDILNNLDKIGVTMQDIKNKIKELSNLDYINLKNEVLDEKIEKIFNLNALYQKGYLPYRLSNNTLYIVTYKIIDTERKMFLEFFKKQGYSPILQYAFKDEIENFFKKQKVGTTENIENIEDMAQFVEDIIKKAIEYNASDIHIEPQKEIIRIRYRIDGVLITKLNIKKDEDIYSNLVSRIKILSNLDIAESRKPQDGRINDFKYENYIFDIRVSTVNTIFGEKIVMRLLAKNTKILSFEELGFEKEEENKIKNILNNKNGIVLLAGATGSGKTTTLYTMIDYINDDDVNIMTIEDPVEKDIPGINQVQVSNYVSFSDILKSFLRQDPDVIVIGEIRDNETAEIAVRSAMTGHLVLATIHAKNIREIPVRLENMGIERYLIANTSVGYLSQRLARRICNHCKKEYELTDYEKQWIEQMQRKYPEIKLPGKFYKGIGCEKCNYTGYKGRVAIVEVLDINDDDRDVILNGGRLNRFNSMEKIAYQKVAQGITTVDEILKNVI